MPLPASLWPRLRTTCLVALPVYLFFLPLWLDRMAALLLRVGSPALAGLLAFSLLEHWPRRLPRWLPRWVAQIIAVFLAVPLPVLAIYSLGWPAEAGPFWRDPERMNAVFAFCFLGCQIGPWTAMIALLRRRDAAVREAERREGALQRQMLDARLQLLQAQVQPHFLFNTLANVQALVEDGSPQAAPVLQQLIAYLRAAVPRLNQAGHTLAQELDMVRAYLALMQLRMPDRLQYRIDAAADCLPLACPPLTLLTLVENAVRHGIDPSLDGGEIVLSLRRTAEGAIELIVSDTGVGLRAGSSGLGTGLSHLRERMEARFGPSVAMTLNELEPHGVQVTLCWPAEAGA